MLINIDESWFSRETRRNYSWLKTGKSWSITNLVFKGSINTISWISTRGEAINMFKYIPSNSNNFVKFLKYVCEYYDEKGFNAKNIGIILNNWAIHRAQVVKRYWINVGIRLFYLPAYCPELAPIELYFSQVKAKLTKGMKGSEIDVKADAFIEELSNCINSISKESISKIWSNFMCTICSRLDDAWVHINI